MAQRNVFLSENRGELCDRSSFLIQEKLGGIDTKGFDDEIVATIDKLLEFKRITQIQQKNFSSIQFFVNV